MKKSGLLSISLLFSLTLASCSSNEITQTNLTNDSQEVQSLASSSKTIKFTREKLTNVKDPDINPNPKSFSVTIKKLTGKNSQNSNVNQVYGILSSAIESLANMEVSYDDGNGNINYDKAKAMSDFVKSTNNNVLRIAASDSSLQGVSNVMKILNLNYSYTTWSGNNKFTYKYTDQKFFNALSYKFLLDSYDGENFNLSVQKVAEHFAQLPSYAQDLKDACFYMYDSIKFISDNVPSLSYLAPQAAPRAESWQLYSGRLRGMLLQISKMPTI